MQTLSPVAVRGDWLHVAEAPLLVSDPLKARYLLGLERHVPSARARKRHTAGILPVCYFRRAIPHIHETARRELEKLLSGGDVLWSDGFSNLVVNLGLNELLSVTLGAQAADTTWFVGLTDGTPTPAAADDLTTHAGWVEVSNYDEVNRVAWVPNNGGVSTAQSLSNSSSPAAFTISATVTIGGSFLADVNTGVGTGNSLYSVGAFTAGDKVLNDNDTLSVTATFTTAAA